MSESMYLSHLDPRYLTASALSPLADLSEPPQISLVGDILCKISNSRDEARDALWRAVEESRKTRKRMQESSIGYVSRWSPDFPSRLLHLDEPVWGLFYRGTLPASCRTLAVVGTRRPDRYGAEVLSRILGNMKSLAIQHVSGLAYGIDSLAHEMTLKRGITNFAVLAGGLDSIYPAEHEWLADEIITAGGGLLSEFPPGTESTAWRFPRRNRIIAALADVVWVPRAARKSGSFHTALKAATYDKILATTPGDAFAELSGLPHALLRANTHLVADAEDLDAILSLCSAG